MLIPKQNFLEPLHHTQTKDLKEVFHHRKKLQGRKLDFDCKKRKQAPEEEIKAAEDKFAESLQLAQVGMHNLMDGSGIEHISQLTQFAESMLEYHKSCSEILKVLADTLYEKIHSLLLSSLRFSQYLVIIMEKYIKKCFSFYILQ